MDEIERHTPGPGSGDDSGGTTPPQQEASSSPLPGPPPTEGITTLVSGASTESEGGALLEETSNTTTSRSPWARLNVLGRGARQGSPREVLESGASQVEEIESSPPSPATPSRRTWLGPRLGFRRAQGNQKGAAEVEMADSSPRDDIGEEATSPQAVDGGGGSSNTASSTVKLMRFNPFRRGQSSPLPVEAPQASATEEPNPNQHGDAGGEMEMDLELFMGKGEVTSNVATTVNAMYGRDIPGQQPAPRSPSALKAWSLFGHADETKPEDAEVDDVHQEARREKIRELNTQRALLDDAQVDDNGVSEVRFNGQEVPVIESGIWRYRKLVEVVLNDPDSSRLAMLVFALLTLIECASVVALAVETLDGPNWGSSSPEFPGLPTRDGYRVMDYVFCSVFAVELCLRFLCSDTYFSSPPGNPAVPFFRDVFTYFDIVAVSPVVLRAILTYGLGVDTNTLVWTSRFSVLGIARVAKIVRRMPGSDVLAETIRRSAWPLLVPLFTFWCLAMITGAALFFLEPCYVKGQCPFTDIFAGAYYAVSTLTATAIGDQTPRSLYARLLAVLIMLVATCYLSVPLIVVSKNFREVWKERERFYASCQRKYREDLKYEKMVKERVSVNEHSQRLHTRYIEAIGRVSKLDIMTQRVWAQQEEKEPEALLALQMAHQAARAGVLSLVELLNTTLTCLMDGPGGKDETAVRSFLEEQVSSSTSTAAALAQNPDDLALNPRLMMDYIRMAQLKTTDPVKAFKKAAEARRRVDRWWQCVFYEFRWPAIYNFLNRRDTVVRRFYAGGIFACVLFSVLLFGAETMTLFTPTGEASVACERVVQDYCTDKSSVVLDSGCYVISEVNGTMISADATTRLSYACESATCFGEGFNFGAGLGVTCDRPFGLRRPFQNSSTLPSLGFFQLKGDRISDVCLRPECSNDNLLFFDFTFMYFLGESAIAAVLSLDLLLRLMAACNPFFFLTVPSNWVDLAGVAVYYIELCVKGPRWDAFMFSTADSSWLFGCKLCKILRVLRLGRSLPGGELLPVSIWRVAGKLVIPLFFFAFATIIFTLLFSYFESGNECFVGSRCFNSYGDVINMTPYEMMYPAGKRILLDDAGEVSMFPDFRYSGWFVVNTLTTIGTPSMVPQTELGALLAGLCMVVGTCYLVLPFSIVGEAYDEEYTKATAPVPAEFTVEQAQLRQLARIEDIKHSFTRLHTWLRYEMKVSGMHGTRDPFSTPWTADEGRNVVPQLELVKIITWLMRLSEIVAQVDGVLDGHASPSSPKQTRWLQRSRARIRRAQQLGDSKVSLYVIPE